MTSLRNAWLWMAGALLPLSAFAEEHGAAAAAGIGPYGAPAAILGLAVAVLAAATAQGKIASSYMEGASRNPGAEKVMKTQLILSLVFVETLVIFTLAVSFLLVNKT